MHAGGQAKRVNIGLALVSDPKVLFLDEPTSGLDSYTANEVCHRCFDHQPRALLVPRQLNFEIAPVAAFALT